MAKKFTSTPLPVKIIATHLRRILKCGDRPRPTESEHPGLGTENLGLQRESLRELSEAWRNVGGIQGRRRWGLSEGAFGEDIKLELEVCLRVRCTVDPLGGSGAGGVFLNCTKSRLLGNRGHGHMLWGFLSLSCPRGHVSSAPIRAHLRTSPWTSPHLSYQH